MAEEKIITQVDVDGEKYQIRDETKTDFDMKVGDVLLTARSDLDDRWALCNGVTAKQDKVVTLSSPFLYDGVNRKFWNYTGTTFSNVVLSGNRWMFLGANDSDGNKDTYLYYFENLNQASDISTATIKIFRIAYDNPWIYNPVLYCTENVYAAIGYSYGSDNTYYIAYSTPEAATTTMWSTISTGIKKYLYSYSTSLDGSAEIYGIKYCNGKWILYGASQSIVGSTKVIKPTVWHSDILEGPYTKIFVSDSNVYIAATLSNTTRPQNGGDFFYIDGNYIYVYRKDISSGTSYKEQICVGASADLVTWTEYNTGITLERADSGKMQTSVVDNKLFVICSYESASYGVRIYDITNFANQNVVLKCDLQNVTGTNSYVGSPLKKYGQVYVVALSTRRLLATFDSELSESSWKNYIGSTDGMTVVPDDNYADGCSFEYDDASNILEVVLHTYKNYNILLRGSYEIGIAVPTLASPATGLNYYMKVKEDV